MKQKPSTLAPSDDRRVDDGGGFSGVDDGGGLSGVDDGGGFSSTRGHRAPAEFRPISLTIAQLKIDSVYLRIAGLCIFVITATNFLFKMQMLTPGEDK